RMFVPFHEHDVQGPVEILTGADAGGLQGFERIEHGAGAYRDAGGAQRASKIKDVLGKPAAITVASALEGEVEGRWPPGGGEWVRHIMLACLFDATGAFTALPAAHSSVTVRGAR